MTQLTQGWRSLRMISGCTLGLGALILAALNLQGQQTGNSVRVQVDQIQGTQPVQAFVEDEFIVVLKKESRAGFRVLESGSSRPQVNSPSLQNLIDRHGVGRFRRQFQTARTQPAGSNRPDLSGHYKVRVPRGSSLEAAVADFANDPQVERVEKIGIHPLYLTPNDSFYSEQWNHRSPNGIDSDLAWNRQTGNSNVVVAILDTGVHYQHPDLTGNTWTNPGEIPGNGMDDDGNGYVDDIRGYDFMESATGASLFTCCDSDCSTADNDPDDNNGHGTHLAGIVAATTNNGFGIAGIAGGFSSGFPGSTSNGVKIMPLRIGWNGALLGLLCGNGLIRMDYAAEALHYVADQKARGINVAAVNASWGSSDSGGLGVAVDEVLASDVMIIHAAGNSAENAADFLGSKVGAMSVAATNQNGAGADFTNFGDYVEISAPGVDITSLWVGPDPSAVYYATLSGTSMAAPHASAVAALLESVNPGLTAAQKFSLMVSNTKPYVNDGRNLGSGILNANLAVGAAGPAMPDFLVSASPGNRIVPVGNSATYDLTVTALSGFSGTVGLSASGLPFGASASFSPGSVVNSGMSLMTVTTGPGTPVGSHPITITAVGGGLTHTVTVTLQVYTPPAVLFVRTNAATQGTWKGVYGGQGYAIADHATSYPAYAQVSLSNPGLATWASSTTDVRALQKPAGSDRIASTWWSATSFSMDVNLIDGNWHQVGLYCVDWDNLNRVQMVEILDGITGATLDSRSMAGFTGGQYVIWNLRGRIKIRVTNAGGYNAVASGVFFDPVAQPDFVFSAVPSSRTVEVGNSASYDVTVTPTAGFSGTASFSVSGLPTGAAASFSPTSVVMPGSSTMTVTTAGTTPAGSYPLTITAVSGGLSHTATVTLITVVPNGVAFVKVDTTTKGSWKGSYGADGYAIANHATSYPAYAQVSLSNAGLATWASSTTDVRALQKPAGSDRIASTWWSATSFSIDVNLIDGNSHQVGLYCVDWDNLNRVQMVEILDGITGATLDSRSMAGFTGGQYVIWNLRGRIKIRVTNAGGHNAVASGLFFDPAGPNFSISLEPTSRTIEAGQAIGYDVSLTSSAGFSGTVNLSVIGLPSGAQASFNPSSVEIPGTSAMTVTTLSTTTAGSYPLTITATDGNLTRSTTGSLHLTVSVPANAVFVKTDITGQGTWKGVYGGQGYAIADHATSYPAYAQVSLSNPGLATWASSTTDVRALQKPAGSDRIASTWWSATSFSMDVNLIDGNWHQVGLYCVDWDNLNRVQMVEILDGITGATLDSRSMAGFTGGQYVIWNLRGRIKIRVTNAGGYNAVASGVFFDPVAQPDFVFSAVPSSRTVEVGNSASYDVTVTPTAGFSGTASFSVSGLPTGAAASFSPTSVVMPGSSTMTVTTAGTTPAGSYPLTITAVSGGLSHTATVTLITVVPNGVAFVKVDTTTKGSWKGSYGADGYAIANHATSYPAYAQVSLSNAGLATWASSTTDVRALQKVNGASRIASTWYSSSSFTIDVNLADGNWHQVGLYCVDWDNLNRAQTVDILDPVTGTVLDSRTLTGFNGGQYVIWNLRGKVRIRITNSGGLNAVVSGVFFR